MIPNNWKCHCIRRLFLSLVGGTCYFQFRQRLQLSDVKLVANLLREYIHFYDAKTFSSLLFPPVNVGKNVLKSLQIKR
jgi:hypothetical protein